MSRLIKGDEVTVACVICMAPMVPERKTCSRECGRELDWRNALVATDSTYYLDPESRVGKAAAEMEPSE